MTEKKFTMYAGCFQTRGFDSEIYVLGVRATSKRMALKKLRNVFKYFGETMAVKPKLVELVAVSELRKGVEDKERAA